METAVLEKNKTTTENKTTTRTGKPKWLRVKLPTGKKYRNLRNLVDKYDLHTICTSGSCPIWVSAGEKEQLPS